MAVRWTIPFMSKKGVSCRVNINDPSFPSSASPMTVTGAADPFFFEEENSDDLLNDVLRYRTGYIRIIDDGDIYKHLDEIYPTSTFNRYVEAYYGSELVFNGYIQVQDFESDLVPTPKVVEFQVISPLGLMDKRNISPYNFPQPKKITLGALLDMVLTSNVYQRVYLPEIAHTELWQEIFSLVVCPWNKDFHHSMDASSGDIYYDLYSPESHAFIVESICKAFGWICHDTPTALVFTSFDYKNSYIYYPVGYIGSSSYKGTDTTPTAAINLTDYFENIDNSAKQNMLLPETGIEITYEGKLGGDTFSFQRTYFHSIASMDTPVDSELRSLCNLTPAGYIQEISATTVFTIDANENLSTGVGIVAWNGNEGMMIAHDWLHNSGHTFFTLRFYTRRRSGQSWKVSYDLMSAADGVLSKLKNDDELKSYFRMTIDSTNTDYVEIKFNYYFNSSMQQLNTNYIVLIHNIHLEVFEDGEPYAEYRYKPTSESDYIRANSDATVSASVNMPMSLYRVNTNQIGSTLVTTKVTEYPYLFQRRLEVVQRFKLISMPQMSHIRLYNYMSNKWRLIAFAFHPWDDEYKLTLQSSPVLNN